MKRRIFCKLLLVAIAIFSFLALPGVLFAQGRSDAAFERVAEVQERHTEVLMARPGVVGTAVGLNDDGGHVVLVLLEKAGVGGIPKELEGVPVRVMVTGEIHALADRRPAPIGVSTGNEGQCSAGTIGCRVTDGIGNVYALSNNHVYALENTADDDSLVLQPGRYDAEPQCAIYTADVIGTLFDFEPIVFSRRARNKIDAAIALTDTDSVGTATPEDGYGTPNSTIVGAVLGQQVQKFGRTTGLTQGEVTGVNATVNVGYGPGKTAKFVKQIIIEPGGFSAGGDSGSLIVTYDDNLNPVGLLFAGSSTMTVANRIDLVLDRFDVTVDDGEAPPPPENDPPTVSITSPEDGSTFDSGVSISFAGTATDTEDGDLTDSLVWTSDGVQIGTKGSFSTTLSDGDHTITATVTDSDGATGSASISITVGTATESPPAGALYVDVTTDNATYTLGDRVYITVTVTEEDNATGPAVEGAAVHCQITTASGRKYAGNGTTDTYGKVVFEFKIKRPDGKGTYSVTANASKSGYDPDSGSTTFEVK